jgi:elongation factor Ts
MMATISAQLVKELRERTGAGMIDCKNALTENAGDLDAATDWLRKKGLAAAAKKASRTAAEGLVGVLAEGARGVVVEINAETDFVGRNETFQNYVTTVARLALDNPGDIGALKALPYPGTGRTVEEELTHMVAIIGENMNLRRTQFLSVNQGAVVSYLHNVVAPGMGRLGVLVGLESTADAAKLQELGKKLAMHIAAVSPQATRVEELNPEVVNRERQVLTEQAKASGKPAEFIEKMIEGRLRKFYEEVVLEEQVFVLDGERKVRQVLEEAAKDFGTPVTIKGFIRFALGEGIEKKEVDFAQEVAAQLG